MSFRYHSRPPLPPRTLDYLARGAAEGQRNAELFDAACQFRDAGFRAEEAEQQLLARATLDGLSEAEARSAIRSAFTHGAREPAVGHAAEPGALPPPKRVSAVQPPKAPLAPVSLPSPIEGGFTKLLDACFAAEEFVAIAPAREDEAGDVVPTRGVTMTREEWKQRIVARGGIEKCFSTTLGLFVRINPMAKNGAKNEHVTSFRHALVEFDRDDGGTQIPKEQQHAAILASGLPVSAVIDSGNKSLHAWVRVDAPDAAEYRRRVDIIWDWFEGRCLDRQNKNPSRLSRCPEGRRTVEGEVRMQQLLALHVGAKSWSEWEAAHAADGLPKIIGGAEFMAVPKPEPPQLITGVLHQGSKMILGGASKSRKSWTLIDMMLSVSTGVTWWGFATQRGRVLYINFELPDFAFQHRLQAIARHKGITDFTGIDLWNLRGFATDFSVLIPKILARVKDERYALIVLDPVYKGLGKRDENKAGDIASLCNEIEQLAVQSGAAVVFGAHYSKGNQAGKDAIDRIGGSGVFARDPDVILTMTPHEDDNAYVVDLTLRALPQVPSFVVRWAGCIFQRDQHADATRGEDHRQTWRQKETRAAGPLPARQPCRPLWRHVRANAANGEPRGDGAQRCASPYPAHHRGLRRELHAGQSQERLRQSAPQELRHYGL
ncbi:Primase 1 [Chthoniobacter flavus Ellin428]|uniref:Primase 1 n=1 Tax=Chthoniobacter flavus Ellin428 TaxID=497964 RepID=B4CXL0_9BACT|nr:AAA family ATPase [Chthoniobacter flavus]EDY21008.1 Primase 1 [Chthoniobacter flavus Ellin428]